ncbi:MAG: T9SS type A sorting domain-containing protein [Bacteroidales bacterium]|nr:T9SS type A sorting domain-containing protein [Bacteroidales bacterium]
MKNFIFAIYLIMVIGSANAHPYIDKIYEYKPAPGQFINTMPQYDSGDTEENMCRKAEELIANNKKIMISLGGYGGYVVFGFDHLVENISGKYDFKILGNAFISGTGADGRPKGSSEPGIVMVSYDANNNQIPDDEWYELAGSEYYKPETIHNYEITYYKPDENKIRTPDSSYPFLNDTTYIRWTANGYGDGYLSRNVYHHQPYYPQWLQDETLTFKGTKLADNYIDESGAGSYYVQYAYDWGYADNHINSDRRSCFNIEWAVDSIGNPVHLQGIHFVKVYTGVNQYCGWIGETSTEVSGAEDLHLTGGDDDVVASELNTETNTVFALLQNPVREQIIIKSTINQEATVYSATGKRVMQIKLEDGINRINCPLNQGLYIIVTNNKTIKFIKL